MSDIDWSRTVARWLDINCLHRNLKGRGRDRQAEKMKLEDNPEVTTPGRSSWTNGTGDWVVHRFAVSRIAALCVKPVLKVNLWAQFNTSSPQ